MAKINGIDIKEIRDAGRTATGGTEIQNGYEIDVEFTFDGNVHSEEDSSGNATGMVQAKDRSGNNIGGPVLLQKRVAGVGNDKIIATFASRLICLDGTTSGGVPDATFEIPRGYV